MSKTLLARVDGWTPVIDAVVLDVGLVSAAVFGKVWRYCQMPDGICRASQDRLADELGMSRATINTHLSKLTETGYLKDLTPDLLGVPHQYADTGKANLSISLTGGVKDFDREGVKNIDTKKEVLKKESKKIKAATPKQPTPPEILIFREVTGQYPPKPNFESVVKIIQSVSKRLGRDATADDLRPFFEAWTFRGFNPRNINWTSWAVSGVIPQNGKQQQPSEPKGVTAALAWLSKRQEAMSNGD